MYTWNLFTTVFYLVSFVCFYPFWYYFYDVFDGPLYMRANEILSDNPVFLINLVAMLAIFCVPFYFHRQWHSLVKPSLKDVIRQNRIRYEDIEDKIDPEKAKLANDAFKKKQKDQMTAMGKSYLDNGVEVTARKGIKAASPELDDMDE